MNRLTYAFVMLAALAALTFPIQVVAQGQDEQNVRAVVMRQAAAWNHHDAAAYAALFTEDCDVVNVRGWWWKGRSELERKLAMAYAVVFRESRLAFTDVQVRFLAPDIALAHARWSMVGAKTPPGVPKVREGLQTLILTKQSGRWLINGFQNTLSVPERQFPAASNYSSDGEP